MKKPKQDIPLIKYGVPLHKWYMFHEEGTRHVCPECGHVANVSKSELEVMYVLQPRAVGMFSHLYAKLAPKLKCVKCGYENPYWMFCIRSYEHELTLAELVTHSFTEDDIDTKIILDSVKVPKECHTADKLSKDFEGDLLDFIPTKPMRGLTKAYTNFGGYTWK